MPPRIELRGITKRFASTLANDDISLCVEPGEIHALLGENGAGKSTLVKIIFGLLRPDAGALLWEGSETRIDSPNAARALGIGMVFQHFSLFERLTVLENVALGAGRATSAGLARRIRDVGAAYGLPLDPDRPVYTLSVGERQRIEIVRCLLQSPRLLIMDEPTSVLTPQEADGLFATLRQLAAEGCAILYISHKLAEIRALCHRATILRAGRVVATCDPAAETPGSLARLMIGSTPPPVPRLDHAAGPVRLELRGLDLSAETPHATAVRGATLALHAGEILGIAGVAGNGQAELFAALSGERRTAPGAITMDGRPIGHLDPGRRRALGLCAVPEERNGHAAVLGFTLAENAFLTARHRRALARAGIIRPAAATRFAAEIIAAFGVRAPGPAATAADLSGGNLQKFVVGREILQSPTVLVVAQPTWGVDAGAAAAIHAALRRLAGSGAAILVLSQDLDELRALADRLAVIAGGVLSDARPIHAADTESIGLLMAGAPTPELADAAG